ncbi:hypothetical protein [Lysinibacter cavernae]|uniref:Transmembrane protein n=1 Tax=Lysinibacter cavernae TaxID=1640652 RepID=A0A7X5QZB5_9MICO|nr:hypothetical protein [Lysinibacter cavernae]NIH52773.1 hypothetical protein [Lysinibacter cavernae]
MATPPVTDRPPYDAFLHKLAGKPMLVTGLTFLLAAAVTIALLVVEPTDVDILGVISLGATVWGLTLALVIYLLTAQDTDRVMDQIADLQEQLAASLIDPDDADDADQDESNASAEPTLATQASVEPLEKHQPVTATASNDPDTGPSAPPTVQRGSRGRASAGGLRAEREAMVYHADAGVPITERIPLDYLDAWLAATGREPDQIIRGWTRGRAGQSPWVLQAADGTRWSVFSSGDGSPSVIELDDPRFRGDQRNRQRRQNRNVRR